MHEEYATADPSDPADTRSHHCAIPTAPWPRSRFRPYTIGLYNTSLLQTEEEVYEAFMQEEEERLRTELESAALEAKRKEEQWVLDPS